MEEKVEKLIFPEKGNILGTVNFKFPEEGKYTISFNGRNSIKIWDFLNKECLRKRVGIVLNSLLEDKLRSKIVTIKKESYEKTNNLYVKMFNLNEQFVGFIHIVK